MKTYALSTSLDGQDTWRDGKKYLWLIGLVVPLPIVDVLTTVDRRDLNRPISAFAPRGGADRKP